MKPIALRLRSTEGAEIAEAALVLPLVFMLMLGIIWFGRAFNIYSTIAQAAQQGAITGARAGTCAICSTSPPNVANAVIAVLKASSLEPGQIILATEPVQPACPLPLAPAKSCTKPNNIWVCSNVLLNSPLPPNQPPQCGVVVSFGYRFPFTWFNLNAITLSAQAQSRMEN